MGPATAAGWRKIRAGKPQRAANSASRNATTAPNPTRAAALHLLPSPPACLSVPDIDVSRSHTLGLDGARVVVRGNVHLARRAADAVGRQLREDLGATTEWSGDALRVRGRGVKGEIAVSDAVVRVTASLGLLARPFRNTLQREIEQQLDRTLSQPA